MKSFKGFNSNRDLNTEIPSEFFSIILPNIHNLYELKTILYVLWFFEHNELEFPCITLLQLTKDPMFLSSFGASETEQKNNLLLSIELAIDHQILLVPSLPEGQSDYTFYFLNNNLGKAAIDKLENGTLKIEFDDDALAKLTKALPNIFRIYEENIGIITPIIADTLKELEDIYPINWIEDAIQEAVKNNVRKLRYIEVILKNWQEEGKHDRTDRKRGQKDKEKYDPDRYIDGEFSDFIDH